MMHGGQDRDAYADADPGLGAQRRGEPSIALTPERGGRALAAATAGPLGGGRALRARPTTSGAPATATAAIAHFNECHRLQPDNWTYKRQAWSLVGNERVGGASSVASTRCRSPARRRTGRSSPTSTPTWPR